MFCFGYVIYGFKFLCISSFWSFGSGWDESRERRKRVVGGVLGSRVF